MKRFDREPYFKAEIFVDLLMQKHRVLRIPERWCCTSSKNRKGDFIDA